MKRSLTHRATVTSVELWGLMARLQYTFWSFAKAKCTILVALSVLPACTQMSVSLNNSEYREPLNLTQSSANSPQKKTAGIEISDKSIITETIETALNDKTERDDVFEPLAWTNPESGNSGTILSLLSVEKSGSVAGCTDFITSANTVGGVRAYEGRSCPDAKRRMQIVQLEPLQSDTPATVTQ